MKQRSDAILDLASSAKCHKDSNPYFFCLHLAKTWLHKPQVGHYINHSYASQFYLKRLFLKCFRPKQLIGSLRILVRESPLRPQSDDIDHDDQLQFHLCGSLQTIRIMINATNVTTPKMTSQRTLCFFMESWGGYQG